jgi:hypothetical protein
MPPFPPPSHSATPSPPHGADREALRTCTALLEQQAAELRRVAGTLALAEAGTRWHSTAASTFRDRLRELAGRAQRCAAALEATSARVRAR